MHYLIHIIIAIMDGIEPPSPPPKKINVGFTEKGSQDLQRPANIVCGGRGIERKVYEINFHDHGKISANFLKIMTNF